MQQPDPAPTTPEPASLSGAQVYLAESYEIIVSPGDPTGLANPETIIHGNTITVGAYSTIAKAEAALDARNSRMRNMTPLGQFAPYSNGLLRYLSPVPGCDDKQWQQIRPVAIDALP